MTLVLAVRTGVCKFMSAAENMAVPYGNLCERDLHAM